MKPKLSNRFIFEKIDGEQTNISINFPSWKSFTRKNIYLGIFSSILSDRLYKIVRIKNGLAYGAFDGVEIRAIFYAKILQKIIQLPRRIRRVIKTPSLIVAKLKSIRINKLL